MSKFLELSCNFFSLVLYTVSSNLFFPTSRSYSGYTYQDILTNMGILCYVMTVNKCIEAYGGKCGLLDHVHSKPVMSASSRVTDSGKQYPW